MKASTKRFAVLSLSCVATLVSAASLPDATPPPQGCGEVCVRLLAHAYGRTYDDEKMPSILQPGKVGETSIARLRDAIAALGLDARIVKGSIDTLTEAKDPVVLFLHKRDGKEATGHFVILRMNSQGKPIIFDPYSSDAPIETHVDAITEVWTGYAILVSEREQVPLPNKLASGLIVVGITVLFGLEVRHRLQKKHHAVPQT